MIPWLDILVALAALVGAAAWIPQILNWIAKPKLEVLSAPVLGITFNQGGASARWTISIAAERQDALITKAELIITHHKGDRRTLSWARLEEELTQLNVPIAELPRPIQYMKPSEVFAIKATTQSLAERTIYFYDKDFFLAGRDKIESAIEHYNYLTAQEENPSEAIAKAKEFKQAIEFHTKDHFWKEGSYDLVVRLKVRGLKAPYEQNFSFTLSKEHVSTLQENHAMFEQYILSLLTGKPDAAKWNYAFVDITPAG